MSTNDRPPTRAPDQSTTKGDAQPTGTRHRCGVVTPNGGGATCRLSNRELVLRVARTLGETFALSDLVVACWREHPERFGLTGHRDQYPDNNRVEPLVYGASGLLARGLLEQIETRHFRVAAVEHGQQPLEYDASVVSQINAVERPADQCTYGDCTRPRQATRAVTDPTLVTYCSLHRHRAMSAERTRERLKLQRQAAAHEALQLETQELAEAAKQTPSRPKTWGECQERGLGTPSTPCPYASCKFSLLVDVNPQTGRIGIPHGDLEFDQLKETCALRVADRGPVTLEEVGEFFNVTRERIRQIEAKGMRRLKNRAVTQPTATRRLLELLGESVEPWNVRLWLPR